GPRLEGAPSLLPAKSVKGTSARLCDRVRRICAVDGGAGQRQATRDSATRWVPTTPVLHTSTKASASVGSNCVPAQRETSSSASDGASASRYGRREVIASKAS